MKAKPTTVPGYDSAQPAALAAICRKLRGEIDKALPAADSKIWHGAPVWFVGGTPVAGYNVSARGDVVLLFWNGQAFRDSALAPIGKFKAAEARYGSIAEIKLGPLRKWLRQAGKDLWDFSDIRRPKSPARRSV